jgi:hypothetical protein
VAGGSVDGSRASAITICRPSFSPKT